MVESCGLSDSFVEDKSKQINRALKMLKAPFFRDCSRLGNTRNKKQFRITWGRFTGSCSLGQKTRWESEKNITKWLKKNLGVSLIKLKRNPIGYAQEVINRRKKKTADEKAKVLATRQAAKAKVSKPSKKKMPRVYLKTTEMRRLKRLKPYKSQARNDTLVEYLDKNFGKLKKAFYEYYREKPNSTIDFMAFVVREFGKKGYVKSPEKMSSREKDRIAEEDKLIAKLEKKHKKEDKSPPKKAKAKTTKRMPIANKVEVGDYVDFGKKGKWYVPNPDFSATHMQGVSNKSARYTGGAEYEILHRKHVKRIIEKGDENVWQVQMAKKEKAADAKTKQSKKGGTTPTSKPAAKDNCPKKEIPKAKVKKAAPKPEAKTTKKAKPMKIVTKPTAIAPVKKISDEDKKAQQAINQIAELQKMLEKSLAS